MRRAVKFISLSVELSCELAKFFFREQIEAFATCRAASGSKTAEVVSGHGLALFEIDVCQVWGGGEVRALDAKMA